MPGRRYAESVEAEGGSQAALSPGAPQKSSLFNQGAGRPPAASGEQRRGLGSQRGGCQGAFPAPGCRAGVSTITLGVRQAWRDPGPRPVHRWGGRGSETRTGAGRRLLGHSEPWPGCVRSHAPLLTSAAPPLSRQEPGRARWRPWTLASASSAASAFLGTVGSRPP